MEVKLKYGSHLLLNKSLICAIEKVIYEWGYESTMPNEYYLSVKFIASVDWVDFHFKDKDALLNAYSNIKKDLECEK